MVLRLFVDEVMPESHYEKEAVGEAWRREIDRLLLSRKMSDASTFIGYASTYPSEQNIKLAFGKINDVLAFVPIGNDSTFGEERKNILAKLSIIRTALFGNRNDPAVLKVLQEFGMGKAYQKAGLQTVAVITNLPVLVDELMKIMLNINDFMVDAGLRIVKKEKKSRGMEKLYEEEGIEND